MPLFHHKNTILVTCAGGIAVHLERELITMGFPVIARHTFGVETEGTLADTMLLNLSIRTGQRVLYLIADIKADTPQDLYRAVYRLPWEEYIDASGYVSITSVVDTPSVNNSQFANLKCKDALADRFYATKGKRPYSGPARDRTVLFLYWKGRRCSLYVDTSGESISRRGYRTSAVEAPLQESLGAALIYESLWDRQEHFINPMCGSGTLAIEAALMGLQRAPGLTRTNFGFMHIKGFERQAWRELCSKVWKQSLNNIEGRIIASDIDKKAVQAARENAARAGVETHIEFITCDFRDTPIPEGKGIVMMNPEYGKRLGNMDKLRALYPEIGNYLKRHCQGYRACIFTGNLELAKQIGLKSKKRTSLFNGPIECRLLEYELYAGSKRKSLE